ncbi:hypothetical protein SESBI_44951 [Sesbania bispinosa]|nr:hypothetical protein SESBI_44951 [Sesbania bispinosa]
MSKDIEKASKISVNIGKRKTLSGSGVLGGTLGGKGKVSGSSTYRMKSLVPNHTCGKVFNNKNAKSRWVEKAMAIGLGVGKITQNLDNQAVLLFNKSKEGLREEGLPQKTSQSPPQSKLLTNHPNPMQLQLNNHPNPLQLLLNSHPTQPS